MPRHERLHYPGAIHIVSVRGRADANLFYAPRAPRDISHARVADAPGVRLFLALVADAHDEYDGIVHGYCVCPNIAILTIQTPGASLTWVMRRLCGQLSLRLHALGLVGSGAVFGSRYESRIVAPELLPHAVRRAHVFPVRSGLCKRRIDYPFSSDRAYQGEPAPRWLATGEVIHGLELQGYFGARGYRRFMDEAERPSLRKLFDQGASLDRRLVGDRGFVEHVHGLVSHPRRRPNRDQIVLAVATLIGRSPEEIHTAGRFGALGRALVAAHATRLGIATANEVGRWFSVTGATLGHAIRYHKRRHPELFSPPGGELPADSPLKILRGE